MTHLTLSPRAAAVLFSAVGLFCLTPFASAAIALLCGVVLAVAVGNPFQATTKPLAQKCLAWSIVGLGAGMNLVEVARAGVSGLALTAVSIAATLAVGLGLGRLLRADRETSTLIAVGTAICGGSAIAAIAPVIKAKPHTISVALGTVFMLNAVALFLFPVIGHWAGLSQNQFGLWSALAIHDTSSVVGAGLQYGQDALHIAATVKLARALWIVPLAFVFGFFYRGDGGKAKKPWFIAGFVIMAAIMTWFPPLREAGQIIELLARKGLVIALFLIGTNLTLATLKEVGLRPLLQGIGLWLLVSSISLWLIKSFLV